MRKFTKFFLLWMLLQACVAGFLSGRRINRGPLPYAPVLSTRADLAGIKTALDAFAVDCGRYPKTSEGLSALLSCPTNISTGLWHGPYREEIPQDMWKHDYVYRCPGTHNTHGFDLYTCGPDGISQSGGADLDDINNWDTTSPHGGFFLDSNEDVSVTFEIMLSLLPVSLLGGVRMLASISSSRVRVSIAQNPLAHIIWFLVTAAVVFYFLNFVQHPPVGR